MATGSTDDEDVYATSDAAWLTEADTDGDEDMGDGDARDASADDAMTDDTSATDVRADDTSVTDARAVETSAADGGAVETNAVDTGTVDASAADPAAGSDAATGTPRPTKGRGGKGRAKRPAGAASTTGTVPPGPGTQPDAGRDQDRQPAPRAKSAKSSTKRGTPAPAKQQPVVLQASGLVKRYGQTLAADRVDLEIRQGSIFGVVGPNGAGKTTTLSMITGLLRPDEGSVTVLDHDVWADPTAAKRSLGVLPDRLRLFDRLTGAQLLYYSATLRGIDGQTARDRSADLAEAFGLGEALGRPVADYSVGMAKKIALAATLIHSPRVLVLDEPFESVDPVSAATITDILRRYTQGGGTVVLSSHSMELVQRTCDSVAIIVGGKVLAAGTMAQVRGRKSLEDTFVELAGGRVVAESMEWLHSFSG